MSSEIRETTYPPCPRAPIWRAAFAAAFCISGSASTLAGTPPWAGKPYAYVVVDQDVRGVLTEFGRNLGVPVVLTDKVRGRVRGEIRANDADEFLRRIAEAQDLTWYFDGSALHVSADEEFSTQVIDAGVDGGALSRELDRLKLSDPRFAIRATADSHVVGVSGPPAFVAVVRQTAERMKPPPRVAGDDPRVRVFRGGSKDEVVRTQASRAPSPKPEQAGGEPGRTP
jgi:type II secretory pathway component GspD/PulD (secretin)